MFQGLGATAAAIAAKSLTEAASAAADYLTSVIIKLPVLGTLLQQEGDEDNWVDTLIDIFKFGVEFIQFLKEEGVGALVDPEKVINFLFKDDLAGGIDRFLGKLLNDPGFTKDILQVVFGFAVLAGVTLLVLKLNSYVLHIGVYSFDYTPEQIYNGETGLTSPYVYPVRFGVALAVILSAPIVFAGLWHIMHHMLIVEFVQAAYGTTTIGTETAEIILSLVDGKTLAWMWITSPFYISFLVFFLVVYVILHLAVGFAWVWHIWRTAQYGDGENTKEVITDTGSWALGLLAILFLTKVLVLLTPGVVNAMAQIVDLATAFSAWIIFLTAFPFVAGYLVLKAGKPIRGLTRNITLKHVFEPPKYQATAGVVSSATRQTIGGLRETYARAAGTLSRGFSTARRLTTGA